MQLDLAIELTADANASATPAAYPRVHHLETLLARGNPLALVEETLDQWLATAFGYDAADPLPYAAFSALGDGLDPRQEYWLRADPVCLSATRTHLILSELPADDLTPAEAQELAAAVAAHLATYDATLSTPHPQRWYLRLTAKPEMRCMPPAQCDGELSESNLPSGSDSALWKRIITEVQMLLHAHPVNEQRAAMGKLPANAVWPWGGGVLSGVKVQMAHEIVFSDDPLVRGLARAAGVAVRPLPARAEKLIDPLDSGATALAVLRIAGIAGSLETLDQVYLAPLCHAIENRRFEAFTLRLFLPRTVIGRQVRRVHLRRWWRRNQPLTAHA